MINEDLNNKLFAQALAGFEKISSEYEKKQQLDFFLICFDSAQVVRQNASKDEITSVEQGKK